MFRSKDIPIVSLFASIRMPDNELPEKITWGKYKDKGYDVAQAHIWKSDTQISVNVIGRMFQNLEL